MTANLQQKLTALEMKVIDYKMLQTRLNATKAQRLFKETIDGIDTSSAMGAFERMEDKVMQLEAESSSVAELGGEGLELIFAQLEASSGVEDELAVLKAQLSGTFPETKSLPAKSQTSTLKEDFIDAELEELRAQLNQ